MSRLSQLPRAVLLDLDDTILDDSGSVPSCWLRACDAHRSDMGGLDPVLVHEAIEKTRECTGPMQNATVWVGSISARRAARSCSWHSRRSASMLLIWRARSETATTPFEMPAFSLLQTPYPPFNGFATAVVDWRS